MPEETTATNTQTETTATAENTETQSTTAEQTNILADSKTAGNETTSTEMKPEDKGETKTEETKPEPKAPEEYADFAIPEGTTLDEASATEFKSIAKELDLTQEQAQKLLDFGGAKIRALAEAPLKLWAETQTKWQAEVKADPEIGGTKFQESIKTAALVFEPGESNPFVGSAEEARSLRDALNATGAGNNPAIVKMFVKMGNILKEPAGLTGNPTKTDKTGNLLDKLYPTMKEAGS